jgi:hypothetical protein
VLASSFLAEGSGNVKQSFDWGAGRGVVSDQKISRLFMSHVEKPRQDMWIW